MKFFILAIGLLTSTSVFAGDMEAALNRIATCHEKTFALQKELPQDGGDMNGDPALNRFITSQSECLMKQRDFNKKFHHKAKCGFANKRQTEVRCTAG